MSKNSQDQGYRLEKITCSYPWLGMNCFQATDEHSHVCNGAKPQVIFKTAYVPLACGPVWTWPEPESVVAEPNPQPVALVFVLCFPWMVLLHLRPAGRLTGPVGLSLGIHPLSSSEQWYLTGWFQRFVVTDNFWLTSFALNKTIKPYVMRVFLMKMCWNRLVTQFVNCFLCCFSYWHQLSVITENEAHSQIAVRRLLSLVHLIFFPQVLK